MTASNQPAQPGPNDHKEARQRQAGRAGVRRSLRDTVRVVDGDTVLNMTPMIDIVFQLIVFFLLTLEFKDLDRRIDAQLPKDRGSPPTAQTPPPLEKIRVKLFRVHPGEAHAFTRIRIGNRRDQTIDLPPNSRSGDAASIEARRQEVVVRMNQLEGWLQQRFEALARDPEVVGALIALVVFLSRARLLPLKPRKQRQGRDLRTQDLIKCRACGIYLPAGQTCDCEDRT